LQDSTREAAGGALRLVHGEADGLPGFIVDRYADTLVAQVLSAGIERWRDLLADALVEQTGCARIYERSDADVRELEGLPVRTGVMRGDAPAVPLEIVEHGLRYAVDVLGGQKTGFYLDQRDNRHRIRELSAGREVLNCFCYTGGFSMAALAGGATSVVSVDSSGPALELARRNAQANGFEASRTEWIEADIFRYLRDARSQGRSFDLIVLDPPKFAPTEKHSPAAARAYKDINLNALKLLRPGGMLATFSCSGGVSADLFQKIVAGAAADAGASATILDRFHASPDHPVLLEFPEGEYLKGLLLRRN
jgi:23S rRNA (cytosine1962-C5)-methyltransferase